MTANTDARPQSCRLHQGDRSLPFAPEEYDARLEHLRDLMAVQGIDACLFTSMHNIAYYSGFLYCAFGRPYGLERVRQKWTPVLSDTL